MTKVHGRSRKTKEAPASVGLAAAHRHLDIGPLLKPAPDETFVYGASSYDFSVVS